MRKNDLLKKFQANYCPDVNINSEEFCLILIREIINLKNENNELKDMERRSKDSLEKVN